MLIRKISSVNMVTRVLSEFLLNALKVISIFAEPAYRAIGMGSWLHYLL
jgi:hypothetical protein